MRSFYQTLCNDHARELARAEKAFERRDFTALFYHTRNAENAYELCDKLYPGMLPRIPSPTAMLTVEQ